MPTNRSRVRRTAREPLSPVQRAYLLDQELPAEGWRPGVPQGDVWWLIVVAHCCGASDLAGERLVRSPEARQLLLGDRSLAALPR